MRYLQTLTLSLVAALPALAQLPCERLISLKLARVTITAADTIPAGKYKTQEPPNDIVHVPAFCRVAATLHPTADSSIGVEVWLPEDWNGKFEAVGGGGWAGNISFLAMAAALAEGYATSSTDTGHKGGDAKFAPGHPEKIVDYAYRAVHEMTVQAKALINARYGRDPKLSYWNGCSTGGRQGLQEAQRYPEDYDAIIAGAPANYMLHLNAWDMQAALTIQKDQAHLVLANKLAMLHTAVVAACDGTDGIKDGLLSNPKTFHFDPRTLLCKGADTASCLTSPQIESVQAMYAPAKRKDGTLVYPGMPYGGENAWTRMSDPNPFPIALSTFQYALHGDAAWDWRTFKLDREVADADEKLGFIHAINPDLSAFRDRGGKLLMYHGWADQLISPENSINYRASVEAKLGGNQDTWYRLFMVPGMQHCRGGEGPNQFNVMGALERWKESSEPPAQILATHVTNNVIDRTRPLCPYPQMAVYKGAGSINDAANFACKAP
jgi:feruloyl esterase